MLAYVFWHTPRDKGPSYEENLVAFHRSLMKNPPPGFLRSAVFSCEEVPWTPPRRPFYEDWYLVEDFAALGSLNEAAVTGPRQAPHDRAAAATAWGTAGIYRLRQGSADLRDARYASWLSKAPGQSYDEFYAAVEPNLDLWRRQLVLGPAPEFCIHSSEPLPVSAGTTRVLNVVYP